MIQQLQSLVDEADVIDSFGWTSLHKASRGLSSVSLREQLELDCSLINHLDVHGQAPLHLAVRAGSIHAVEVLIDHGANPNQRDKFGRSPLYDASLKDNAQVAKVLLENGADTDIRDAWGQSALSNAAYLNAFKVAMVLLDYRADITITDVDGYSTLR